MGSMDPAANGACFWVSLFSRFEMPAKRNLVTNFQFVFI